MGKLVKLLILTVITLCAVAVSSTETKKNMSGITKLRVAMDTSYCNYFLQKGTPCGFQLELLELFARHTKTKLEFCMLPDSLKFRALSEGKVDMAVFSSGLDSLYSIFNTYRNLCSSLPLDDEIKTVWLTREIGDLALSINVWAAETRESSAYRFLVNKYFNRKIDKTFGKISPYDRLVKKYSDRIGWDWRLLAAVIYKESTFRPDIVSRSGAQGLMQLMPETAADMNVNDVYNPEDNIRGGVRLLGLLDEFFAKRGVAEDERLYFILAGYNAGHGRIEKCMEAAEAMDLDKYKWASIYSVINMSIEGKRSKVALPKFHTRETLDFVDTIIKIYEHYRCFVS